MANDKPDNLRWRDKYLDISDELDKYKKRSDQHQENLRRGLSMASLLAEGQTELIDTQMGLLRTAARSDDRHELPNALRLLERHVRDYEKHQTQQNNDSLKKLNQAADQLLCCPLPAPLLKRIKALKKRLKQELNQWSGYAVQLDEWAVIMSDLATLEGFDEKRPGWWKRWFESNKDTQDNSDKAPIAQEPVASSKSAEVLNTTRADAQPTQELSEPGFSRIADDVTTTLRYLLSRLVVPKPLEKRAESINERLNARLNWYELVPLLESTSDFLLEYLGDGQAVIEQFLHTLDKRLKILRDLVVTQKGTSVQRTSSRNHLHSLVMGQMQDIHSIVSGSDDLEQIGASVTKHVDMIVAAMNTYQSDEETREKALEEQLEAMQARLIESEAQVIETRQKLDEQRHLATHDALTGLPNREAYERRLQEEFQRHRRYGGDLSMLVADLDYFKRINDTYGHQAGDMVLKLMAQTIKNSIRAADFVSRFGGEEFVILMPHTNAEQAMQAAEIIRQQIENTPFHYRQERVQITMSIGLSHLTADDETPEALFERSDKALYRAKDEGRNRCCCD